MARLFDNTQLEYLKRDSAVISDYASALVCWFKPDDITNGYCLMWTGNRLTNADTLALYCQGAVGGDPVRFQQTTGGNPWLIADTTAGYTANTWHHACGIWVGTNELRVYLDGGNRGVSLSYDSMNINTFSVGVLARLAKTGYMSGAIAEAAIFNLAYYPGASLADKADNFEKILPSLAAGFSPLNYPLGLVAYWRLHEIDDAGNDSDIVGHHDLTPFNVPTFTDHSRTFLPTRSQIIQPRMVLPSHGKLKNEPILTGKIKVQPAVTGLFEDQPALTGELLNRPALTGLLENEPALTGKLKNDTGD